MQKKPFLRPFILFFIVSALLISFAGYYHTYIVPANQHLLAEANCDTRVPQKDITIWHALSMHLLSLSR
jgi:hypothetical protein